MRAELAHAEHGHGVVVDVHEHDVAGGDEELRAIRLLEREEVRVVAQALEGVQVGVGLAPGQAKEELGDGWRERARLTRHACARLA